MTIKTIGLAAAFAPTNSLAMAQTGNSAGGSSQAGGPGASQTTTGDSMNGSTTGPGGGANMKNGATGPAVHSSTPSPRDANTQDANTAGSADKKGDAASPAGRMKK